MKYFIFTGFMMLALVFTTNAQAEKTVENRCPGNNTLTETEINEILEAHNKARADLKLPPLTWDCKLANLAQEWAARGEFEHRPDNDFGENLSAFADANKSPASGIQGWMLEKPFWNNTDAKCEEGKVCYHYTQVVWKDSAKVGCGINRAVTGKWKTIFVCNYDPAGNYPGPAY